MEPSDCVQAATALPAASTASAGRVLPIVPVPDEIWTGASNEPPAGRIDAHMPPVLWLQTAITSPLPAMATSEPATFSVAGETGTGGSHAAARAATGAQSNTTTVSAAGSSSRRAG